MELKDLVGRHMLDAVDYGDVQVPDRYYGDGMAKACRLRMRIDGVTWVCEEDPEDGYRSSMRDLRMLEAGEEEIQNNFGYVLVDCTLQEGEHDLLEIVDVRSGEVIIEVGTDRADDYYPSFVANWNPAGLYFNKEKENAS